MIRGFLLIGLAACCALPGCGRTDETVPDVEGTRGSHGEAEDSGTHWAVLVGINQYGWLRNLEYAVNDMEALGKVLIQAGGYEEANVRFLLGGEATRGRIYNTLGDVRDLARKDDTIVFAFAGHGILGPDDQTYLVPSDGSGGDDERLKKTCLPISDVVGLMRESKARHRILILDCCHAGGAGGVRNVGEPDAADTRQFELMYDAMKEVIPRQERFVKLLSCGKGEVSRENRQLQHGIFTHYLIEGIRSGATARDDGRICIFDVAKYVQKKVPRYVEKTYGKAVKQTPEMFVGSVHPGEIMLAKRLPQQRIAEVGVSTADLALVTLPGPSGGWWFEQEQMRTFLPEMRRSVSLPETRHVARPIDGQLPDLPGEFQGVLDPNVAELLRRIKVAVESDVRRVGKRDPPRGRLIGQLMFDLIDSGREATPENVPAEQLLAQARKLNEPASAEGYHLVALMEHRLNRREAQESYQNAIKQYESALEEAEGADPAFGGLYALCLSDLGHFYLDWSDGRNAAKYFRHAREQMAEYPPRDVLLFRILCKVQEAAARRLWARSQRGWNAIEQLMNDALVLAERYLDDRHPLFAHLHERRAWMLMDQWRVREALEEFEETIRRYKIVSEDRFLDPPWLARTAIWHAEHGLAMCALFSGESHQARQRYETLYGEILERLEEFDPFHEHFRNRPDQYRAPSPGARALVGRLVNTAERLGDAYLMSVDPVPGDALTWYRKACDYANRLPIRFGAPNPQQARALAKIALAAAVAGGEDQFLRAGDRLATMQPDDRGESDGAVPGNQPQDSGRLNADQWKESVKEYWEAAQALHDLHSDLPETVATARQRLRSTLHETASAADGGLHRETVQLLLLVWERLIRSHLSEKRRTPPPDQLAKDADLLFDIRPAHLTPEARSYLKHYQALR